MLSALHRIDRFIKANNPDFCTFYTRNLFNMNFPTIYRSVESVLNVLTNHKSDSSEAVNVLLQVYNNALEACNKNAEKHSNNSKHPFIILEGLDGCGKSTITKKLASKLNATRWCTPPESIKHIRGLFDNNPQLRGAYYALGNYIAALECFVLLQERPVVMDRYWHSTSAYAIAQAVHDFRGEVEMPPTGDSFYEWPSDLLKPDVVLFLHVNENNRLQRLSRRTSSTTQENQLKNSQTFRDNVIFAYKNMANPEVVFIDANLGVNKVIKSVEDKLKSLLKQ